MDSENNAAQEMFDAIEDYVARAVLPLIDEIEALKAQIKAIPAGERGPSAFEVAREYGFVGDAVEWLASLRGERGEQGIPGRDGRDAAGRDGLDGWSPEDLEIETLDGGRKILVRLLKDGQRCVQRTVQLDIPLYRGVWKSGGRAESGDTFTYGGSLWIANEATGEPPGASRSWTLAVKRGRDAQ